MLINSEFLQRALEVGGALAVSMVTAAVTVSWSLSAALADFKAHDLRQDIAMQTMTAKLAELDGSIGAAILEESKTRTDVAVLDARWSDIVRRLDEIRDAQRRNFRSN